MGKKYILTDETYVWGKRTLYRIKAIRDFGNVKEGDLGGFIEKEGNLSQEGECWVYDNARVYGEAEVFEDASVSGYAKVFDNATIFSHAKIFDHACVYGGATVGGIAIVYEQAHIYGEAYVGGAAHICDNARVHGSSTVNDNTYIYGYAQVYGDACIYDEAHIYDNARIYDRATIYGKAHVLCGAKVYNNARIYGNAYISGNAEVCSDAHVYGDAYVCEHASVQFSRLKTDLRKDLKASLRCQCNLIVEGDKVVAYKVVYKDLSSLHDGNFVYEVGKIAICENPREDNSSCSPGLHFSNLTYWDNKADACFDDLIYLKAEIKLKDIITVQEGKIRCRKAKILDKIEIE